MTTKEVVVGPIEHQLGHWRHCVGIGQETAIMASSDARV